MKSYPCLALAVTALCCLVLSNSQAGDAKKQAKSTPKEHVLWPEGAPLAKGKARADIPTVTVYLPPADKATGAAIVICPGGGYGGLAIDHEGHQVARWLNSIGVAGVILKYRVAPYRFPAPLLDAQRALRYTRAHAKEWGIDPKRVGILGFSAGGHLASTAATQFGDDKQKARDAIDTESCRPDFAVLVYPVITLTGKFAHNGSRINLLGKDANPQLIDSLCNQKRVTTQTPPTFLVHTTEDTGVPPENSILFYEALRGAKVPAEMHIYEKGRHGLGLGQPGTAFASWPGRCADWLKGRGILRSAMKESRGEARYIVIGPADTNIAPGRTADVTVGVERLNQFNGDITVKMTHLPPGKTAKPAEVTITKGNNRKTFTLTAAANTNAVEHHVVTISTAGGGAQANVSFKVRVSRK